MGIKTTKKRNSDEKNEKVMNKTEKGSEKNEKVMKKVKRKNGETCEGAFRPLVLPLNIGNPPVDVLFVCSFRRDVFVFVKGS